MSELKEERFKQEILNKLKEFQYQTAVVECALFKQNKDENKWYIYILKITLERKKHKEDIQLFIEKDRFVLFRKFWSIQLLKGFLSALTYVRKAYNENNQSYPKEGIVFNIGGYQAEICGNYPRDEMQFVGSDIAKNYYNLRADTPFYMVDYALYTGSGGILNTRPPNLEGEDPPFSNPAQAVNHYFDLYLDTNNSDFRGQWVGIILPVCGVKIKNYKVTGKNLKIEIDNDGILFGKERLDLNVICQNKEQRPFSKKLLAEKKISIPIPFLPSIVNVSLFKGSLKLDHCTWQARSGIPFRMKNNVTDYHAVDLYHLFDDLKFHPKVARVSQKAFESRLYAESILNAFKEVIVTVRKVSKLNHLDGKPLMEQAFSINNPKIKLNNLQTQSEKDEQIGFMHIFSGVALGIRNPKAHENIEQKDPYKALEYLSLASLLMKKIDERAK
jgi:uncharacterized protein (TIGR02391 family)